jgi:hypothetical protein
MTYLDLLKSVEYWTGMKEGDISGDTNLKAVITSRINRRLERYLGMLGAGSTVSRVDDTNYTNQPFSLFDIVENQHDYEFKQDEDGNEITDITAVLIKKDTTSNFYKLDRITLDNPDAELIMSPNSDKTGIPTSFLERNNTIFFNVIPNFSLTEGGKLFYKRVPSYFVVGDTTKEPGIPTHFHEMLAIGVSYDWLLVNKSNARSQITIVRDELIKLEDEFRSYEQLRNPFRAMIKTKRENTR